MDLHSGAPFWLVRNGLGHSHAPLRRDEQCDIAIIGAGVTGALVADALTSLGKDVVLIDRRDAGLGSTSASTALLQYEIDVELEPLIALVGEPGAVRSYQLGIEAIADLVDIVEVFNGRSEEEANRRAEDLCDILGAVPGAGSDAHSLREIGSAYVEMEDFEGAQDFLAKLRGAKIVKRRRRLLLMAEARLGHKMRRQ